MNKFKSVSSLGGTAQVRRYVRDRHVRPARLEGRETVRVVVGDVHKALGFRNRVPLVCNALASRKFLEENALRLVKRTGPPSGQSTTVEFTYELLENREIGAMEALRELRGIGKQTFKELGGGEKFLREERERLFGAGEDKR